MKVFVIIDSGGLYGKERANLQVANILKDAGMDVTLLVNEINTAVREEIKDFRTFDIPFPRRLKGKILFLKYVRAFFLSNKAVYKLLRKEKPDYLLVPTEIELAYLYPTLRRNSVKVVFRCGDSPLVNRKHGVAAKIYAYLWKNLFLKRVDTLVCNARFIQEQMFEAGRSASEGDRLIYNYPPERRICEDDIVYASCEGAVRFGFLGRLVADKGVKELIEATIALTKKGHKVMTYIGGGNHVSSKYIDGLYHVVEEYAEVASQIQFLGSVKDLDKFFANVDVVVIPSIYPEPMANVATEAKFHHKPVVIFNQGGLPEIVRHQTDGYICNDVSVEGLMEGLLYYIENPDMIAIHGENAYRSIELLDLTKASFTNKWLDVFQ